MHFPASGGMPWAIVQGMDKEEAEEMKSQLQGEPVDLLFCLCAVLSGFVVKDSRAIKECVDSVNNLGTIFRHPSDEYRASYSDVSKELSVTMARLKTIEAGTKYILDVCNHVLRIVGPEKIDEFFACKLLKNAATAHLYDNESIQAVIDIDLRVVYNIISQQNNRINISIARAARRDSSSMKIIALLTMLFLPGTYISSLFAMPLFDWTAMKGDILYRYNAKYHASSALLWACEKGILDTVLRFLEYNTNDNTRLSSDWKGRDHPLYVAAKNGYDEIVRTLLQEGVKVDATSNRRRTAISIAASNGHQSVVDELLCAGADYDLADDERKTPLSWAAEHGFVAVVEQLVAAGANINHIDIHGQTPLYLAAWRGRDESVRQLLQAKADTSISADITGLTALSIAAFKGNSAIVKQLIKAGADIHHTNATGNTPLMLAVCIRHIATVRELLHAGAKTTGCSTNRENALAWAAEHGDIDMVRILIEAGADVKSTHPDGRNALSFAAERGHIEICKILVQAGSEVDSVDMLGRTALSWAAEHGSIDQFIYLWQLDPQLGQTDRFGRSPLSWAAEKGHNDIISFVVSQRAPLDITHKGNWDVELISDAIRKLHRSTFKLLPPLRFPWQFRREEFRREDAATLQRPACNPLGIAVAQGHTQAVKTLLDAGAATDIKDITGFTPLMLAAKRGDLHVVSLLVSAGASLDRKCQRGWDAAKIASASGHHSLAFYLNRESGRMRYTSP
ncbi:hypothetical protein KXW65_003610 [Aspergillus fumigatus]|nr:hypothetical protein KXW65_003610 [Aspergillus fumigatus]